MTERRTALARLLPLVPLVLVLSQPLAAQQADDPDASDAGASAEEDADGELPEGVLAIVNDRTVPTLSLENVYRQLVGQGGEEPDRERIAEELIDLEILTQAGEALSLDERPEIAAALQLQYTRTMANAYLAEIGDELSFSEEELRAEYERQSASIDGEEYRASHILLENETDAEAVIGELADGADFAELAASRSIDPAGQNSGGDLGWFQPGVMVPEFVAAVERMDVGETSAEAVETDFGFHVIRLDEKRGAALPGFDSVRQGLRQILLRDRLAERLDALREAADVIRR